MSYLPGNLKYQRLKKAVNQEYIANLVKKKANTISNWENGLSEPSISELLILSVFFEVNTDDLLKKDLSKKRNMLEDPVMPYGDTGLNVKSGQVNDQSTDKQLQHVEKRLQVFDQYFVSIAELMKELILVISELKQTVSEQKNRK